MTLIETSPTLTDAPAPTTRRETFWAVAGRAFWRQARNRIATGWVVAILLISVVVPFLANSTPYTAVINGRREFPLFYDLTRVDWLWLIWGFAVASFMIVLWRTGKRPLEIERGS